MSQYDDLKAELLEPTATSAACFEEHQEYERRLEEINHKSLLSQDDEVEEKKDQAPQAGAQGPDGTDPAYASRVTGLRLVDPCAGRLRGGPSNDYDRPEPRR